MNKLHKLWRFTYLILTLSLMLTVTSAYAQGTAFAAITSPNFSKFPVITTYLDAFDDQGNFISGLTTSETTVLENGELITPDKLERLQPPLNFVLAVNSDPALAIRDSYGDSRYDKITFALNHWVSARPADSQDKLALVWNGGVIGTKLTPAEWKIRFGGFKPELRSSSSGLSALAFALDAAQEAQSSPTIKKSILLISPHLTRQDQNGLNALVNRAKQAGVKVYVWMTDSSSYLENPGALVLQELALATGGRYTAFTGKETLPDLEEWLSPLRNVYQLTYNSNIREGGQQTLTVQVSQGNLALTSPAVSFALEVQPPSPVLLSAPINIVRQNPDNPFDTASFSPIQQEISTLVEFPDGFPRALTRTTLYVDGQKVAENTSEPFEHFTWGLSGYIVTDTHSLQVEAEDTLGLSRMSAEVPVQVTVVQPPGGMAGLILRNRFAVTIAFLVLAGAVVLGIIFLGGRKGLATLAERRKSRSAQLDPVTQPVLAAPDAPSIPRANPFPWLRHKADHPPAYFVKLTSAGAPAKGTTIPLAGREITFGTDPTQATIVLDHPSLSGLHARLRLTEADIFILFDQNSVAGTWVNYDSIPQEGQMLKHGDVIHFGQLAYRFVLTMPPPNLKPTITPLKTDDP